MEAKVALFMTRFNELKASIHSAPQKIAWAAENRTDLQDLCYQLDSAYNSLRHLLSTKGSKHSFVGVPSFEKEWNEYEREYALHVAAAGEPAHQRSIRELEDSFKRGEETWVQSGKTKDEYWKMVRDLNSQFMPLGSAFDPLNDNPAALAQGAFDFVREVIENEHLRDLAIPEELCGDYYERVIGAWEFFRKTIGLDLEAIYTRWRKAPELFVQPHVAQVEEDPLVRLYDEAVRTYVHGNKVAAVAMCRAIMEHTLVNHYKVKGENLKKTIAIAEQQFPQLAKWDLQKKRELANDMLHKYERATVLEDIAVVNYLRTIKFLVQNVPNRKGPKR